MSAGIRSPEEIISIRGLWAGYEQEEVLENINLSVQEHDFIGLIGPNGGGKTTLIKVILGLLSPTRGEVTIMGQPVHQGRRYIGYVPQILQFDREFPISVQEVVHMGRLHRRSILHSYTTEDQEAVRAALEHVAMWDHRSQTFGELSGGQRQRVLLARALAAEPEVLILDEPIANIDQKVRTHIYELLRQLNQTTTIIMSSHDLGAVSAYVTKVACLNRFLVYHESNELTEAMLEAVYQCPIELIAHGIPHRVLKEHTAEESCL